MIRVLFVAHNGYGYPHSRVRCYNFARVLAEQPGFDAGVLSFRQDLAPHRSEEDMYFGLRDRHKLGLTLKAVPKLFAERKSLVYIQKAHFHSAAPFLLHRLGFVPRFVFDYDDYDIPLSNFFGRGIWNRLFFGTNRWDEITYRHARESVGCVASSYRLEEFLRGFHDRVIRIPTGVDTQRFQPGKPGESRVVYLWNGIIWGEPILQNVLMVLRAFTRVSQKVPHARLLIVGEGRMWDRVTREIGEYGALPVETRRSVPPDEMPDVLREADVGLLPVVEETPWAAAKSPTKLFEYMAAGLAVVASEVGEAARVIENGRDGILARNETEFADGMFRVGCDSLLRRSLGESAHSKAVEQYSLSVLGKRLAAFLSEVTQAGSLCHPS